MNLRNLCILMMIFSSCSVNKSVIGNYNKIVKGYNSTLSLKNDSTFIYTVQYQDVNSKCQGRWLVRTPKEILLKCNEENFPAEISGGYMTDREIKVILVNSRKIQIGSVVLSKDKD